MTATEKVFWSDPYLTEIQARIRTVDGDVICLDRTIFYALSGGQESDEGTIGGHRVLEAKKHGHEIFYRLEKGHNFTAGNEVTVIIDWDRRYRLMRLHFAAEIVLELVYKKFTGIEKIGAHIAADKARIDFKWEENFSPYLVEFQQDANKLVAADIGIISDFDDVSTERRYWEIPGFSKVPCGGTHLKRTGEIGTVRLNRDNIGKGKQRIIIFAD
jgi:Ser-tRNA(Ala) deacylase AlaX